MNNSSNSKARFVIHTIVICSLVFGGVEIGYKLATLFYYDVLNLVDPYYGATITRVLLTFSFAGVVSSLVAVIYAEVFGFKEKYKSFLIAYAVVIIFSVMREIVLNREFPSSLEFWVYSMGVLVFSAISVIAIHYMVTKKTSIDENRLSHS